MCRLRTTPIFAKSSLKVTNLIQRYNLTTFTLTLKTEILIKIVDQE